MSDNDGGVFLQKKLINCYELAFACTHRIATAILHSKYVVSTKGIQNVGKTGFC